MSMIGNIIVAAVTAIISSPALAQVADPFAYGFRTVPGDPAPAEALVTGRSVAVDQIDAHREPDPRSPRFDVPAAK